MEASRRSLIAGGTHEGITNHVFLSAMIFFVFLLWNGRTYWRGMRGVSKKAFFLSS